MRVIVAALGSATVASLATRLAGQPEVELVAKVHSLGAALQLAAFMHPDRLLLEEHLYDELVAQPRPPYPPAVLAVSMPSAGWGLRGRRAGLSGVVAADATGAELVAALRRARRRPPINGGIALDNLSPRQSMVLQLASGGLTNREIGVWLGISELTVKNHMAQAMGRLQSANRVEAVLKAAARGLIQPFTNHVPAVWRTAKMPALDGRHGVAS